MSKRPVLITVDSVCDLPIELVRKYNIVVNPYFVETPNGRFMDQIEIGHEGLVQFVDRGGVAKSASPEPDEYEWFFEKCQEMAEQIIHLTIANRVGVGYEKASLAAKKFSNVTVYNSHHLSSAIGLMAIRASEYAMLGMSVEEIVDNLDHYRKCIRTEFLLKDLEYMYRAKRLPKFVRQMSYRFVFRLVLQLRKDKIGVRRVMVGSWENIVRRYIRKLLKYQSRIDERRVFVTHVGLEPEMLRMIASEIYKYVTFEEVVFVNATASISCNCGRGTFGILFAKEDGTDIPSGLLDQVQTGLGKVISPYKSRAFFTRNNAMGESFAMDMEQPISSENFFDFVDHSKNKMEENTSLSSKLKFLDWQTGLMYAAGNEELYIEILKEYISDDKSIELEELLKAKDWDNYRILVHALKSTSKTIGVNELSEEARLLEYACKDGKFEYVIENHKNVMEHYKKLCRRIWEVIG